ncbi:MAG: diacylglycerol/lipid kinase family protein [Candidatus Aminicenantia bacterium]
MLIKRNSTFPKTRVIVNPEASKGETKKRWAQIKTALKSLIKEFKFEFTEKPLQAIEITRESIKDGYEFIVGVGGDGTINEIANGFFENERIMNPEATMGIIPSGTGNDFVKSLKIPRRIKDAINHLKDGRILRIDVGKVRFVDHNGFQTTRFFLNVADFGIGGEVVKRVNKKDISKRGKWAYWRALFESAMKFKGCKVKVFVGNREFTKNFFIGAIANGRIFGGNMLIAPSASVEDGLFDIVLVESISFIELMRNAIRLIKGTHLTHPKVEFLKDRIVKAIPEEGNVMIEIDGEQPGFLPAIFEVVPEVIRVKGSI